MTFPKGSPLPLAERLERLAIGVSADVRQLAVVRMLRGLEPLDGKLAPLDIEVAGAALDRNLR